MTGWKKFMVLFAVISVMSTVWIHTSYATSPRYTNVEQKGIWVWGATIRNHEQEFADWISTHSYTDVFVLIKGVSGVVKYDVIDTLLSIRNSDPSRYNFRIWAWLVGFHDQSHADSSWDYLVGDWVSPADLDYRNYLCDVVKKVIDPALGYVSDIPDGVMLDDTFQWPSASYGGNTSNRIREIMNTVDSIKSVIESVEANYSCNILLGFAPHPETDVYYNGGSYIYTYASYYYGQDFGEIAKRCDWILPETYRYGFYNEPSSWIASVVDDIRNEINLECPSQINVVKIYPVLVLYYSDTDPTPISSSSLQDDINYAVNASSGFSVFRYASNTSNPGNGADSHDLPTADQSSVIDNFGPGTLTLSDALESSLSWSTGGDAEWFATTSDYYYDGDSARSGNISDSQSTWISTTVSGKGTVKFYWKVSSEINDTLTFYVDGTPVYTISGNVNWEERTYTIDTAGIHELKWVYAKDSYGSGGEDCGYLDYVIWIPESSTDNETLFMYHQQPCSYNDPGFSAGSYKGWCGVASMYICLHSMIPDLPARLKAEYPSWTDPDFGRGLIEADPYIYHYGSTYAVESLMVNVGIGYDSGTAGYGYGELTNIPNWINNLNIGLHIDWEYVSLGDMKTYLQNGWMAVMNVKTGHYVAVVHYTYDDPNDAEKRYYWILDPWPTSYIGPGSTWDPTDPDPDGDGVDEFNVNLTWKFRKMIWSSQPNGTTSYYQGIYVMTGVGISDVFRDQIGDGTLLMVKATWNDAENESVLFAMPSAIPSDQNLQNDSVRSLKMVNGYLYSHCTGYMLLDDVSAYVKNPENGSWILMNIPKGSIILEGVSAYYARIAAQETFGYSTNIYSVDMTSFPVTRALTLNPPRIMYYTGTGTIPATIEDRLKWFRFKYDAYSDPTYIDRLSDPSFRYSIFFVPGGSATDIASGIGENRLRTIAEFVANGGGYIGVCAGSYLPIKGYNTETSWLEIVNASVSVLNPGEGIVTIRVEDPNCSVMLGFNGEFNIRYYNGPPLEPGGLYSSTLGLPTPYPSTAAKFVSGVSSSLIGKTAILYTTYGSGKIVLFSPHPEFDDVYPGRYLWRLFFNAIYTVNGEEVYIGYVPEIPGYDATFFAILIIAVIAMILGRWKKCQNMQHFL